jgi:putative transposase
MEDQYIYESPSVHLVLYHVIFCMERRKKVLEDVIHDRLQTLIEQVVEENHWHIERLAIQPNHVHLFVQINPYMLPTDIARLVNGRSSHDLREEFPELLRLPSLWTRSTFYSTAGHVSQEIINRYIEEQARS